SPTGQVSNSMTSSCRRDNNLIKVTQCICHLKEADFLRIQLKGVISLLNSPFIDIKPSSVPIKVIER
ncbi:MAG: hypothetical protein ACFFC7_35440, partial [Candidatus Hermodarchaeota archaeon]